MTRVFRCLCLAAALTAAPRAVQGQLCYPGMSLCFSTSDVSFFFAPQSDPDTGDPITLVAVQVVGSWSYWNTDWVMTQLFWSLALAGGTTLALAATGQPLAPSPTGGDLPDDFYDTYGAYYPGTLGGPATLTLTGMRTETEVEGPVFSCGTAGDHVFPGGPCAPPMTENVVPEPSSFVLLATGLLGLGLFAMRRRKWALDSTPEPAAISSLV